MKPFLSVLRFELMKSHKGANVRKLMFLFVFIVFSISASARDQIYKGSGETKNLIKGKVSSYKASLKKTLEPYGDISYEKVTKKLISDVRVIIHSYCFADLKRVVTDRVTRTKSYEVSCDDGLSGKQSCIKELTTGKEDCIGFLSENGKREGSYVVFKSKYRGIRKETQMTSIKNGAVVKISNEVLFK